jgi:hypothetical protein
MLSGAESCLPSRVCVLIEQQDFEKIKIKIKIK